MNFFFLKNDNKMPKKLMKVGLFCKNLKFRWILHSEISNPANWNDYFSKRGKNGQEIFLQKPFQRAEFEENINHSVELCRINKDFELFTNSIKNH